MVGDYQWDQLGGSMLLWVWLHTTSVSKQCEGQNVIVAVLISIIHISNLCFMF